MVEESCRIQLSYTKLVQFQGNLVTLLVLYTYALNYSSPLKKKKKRLYKLEHIRLYHRYIHNLRFDTAI